MSRPEEKTILVVDDEEDVRDYLSTVLEDAGFNVVTAADGIEAIERVKEQPPDFISLDLVMPRKSGIKFLYELRHNKDWARIQFIIVTAHAQDDLGKGDLKDILAGKTFCGPNVYLEKPVKPEQYVQFICKKLSVEYEAAHEETGSENLKKELEDLLEGADKQKLKEAIRLLKEK